MYGLYKSSIHAEPGQGRIKSETIRDYPSMGGLGFVSGSVTLFDLIAEPSPCMPQRQKHTLIDSSAFLGWNQIAGLQKKSTKPPEPSRCTSMTQQLAAAPESGQPHAQGLFMVTFPQLTCNLSCKSPGKVRNPSSSSCIIRLCVISADKSSRYVQGKSAWITKNCKDLSEFHLC